MRTFLALTVVGAALALPRPAERRHQTPHITTSYYHPQPTGGYYPHGNHRTPNATEIETHTKPDHPEYTGTRSLPNGRRHLTPSLDTTHQLPAPTVTVTHSLPNGRRHLTPSLDTTHTLPDPTVTITHSLPNGKRDPHQTPHVTGDHTTFDFSFTTNSGFHTSPNVTGTHAHPTVTATHDLPNDKREPHQTPHVTGDHTTFDFSFTTNSGFHTSPNVTRTHAHPTVTATHDLPNDKRDHTHVFSFTTNSGFHTSPNITGTHAHPTVTHSHP